MNIKYPDRGDHITIDRHAYAIAIGERHIKDMPHLTNKQYGFLADCYRYTANKINMSPLCLQSKTWENHRIIKKQRYGTRV